VHSIYSGRRAPTGRNLFAALAIAGAFCAPAFAKNPVLTLSVSGLGTIGSPGTGVTCAATCSSPVPAGTSVTLVATPAAGQAFAGWGGACSGTANCRLTVRRDTRVTARFVAAADRQAPALSILSPTSTGAYSTEASTITLAGNATDNVQVTQINWSSSTGASGSAVLAGSGWSAANVPLQPGLNTLTVTARDAAGNSSAAQLAVTRSGATVGVTRYLSPTGSDSADCLAPTRACKTFAQVFARTAPGDELVLLDGVYSAAAGTGTMHWNNGAQSAQIPSGLAGRPTRVRALNPGRATVQGQLFIGRTFRKDSHITVQGLRFEGGVTLYNTSFVTLKDTGVHGALDLGTNDHDQGNTDNLIEDVWVWAAQERVIAINYRAHRNVWRRVVVRGDGCNTEDCTRSGHPNVGFTVYDSHDVSVQNVMVLDRLLHASAAANAYSDFAIASHTGGLYTFGRNEWLGTISLNAPDTGYYMEPDQGTTEDKTIRISNAVAWNSATGGFNFARAGSHIELENMVAYSRADDAFRVAPELAGTGTLRNVVVRGSGRYGLNSAYVASHVNVTGQYSEGTYNQTVPVNVVAGDPVASGALRHVTRVEAGSMLSGKGFNGSDLGATVLNRYGKDGTRHGEAGFNTLTTTRLWPWPNEDRIKADLCAATTRGLCTTGRRLDGVNPVTLTSYVWEAVGQPMPADVYALPPAPPAPQKAR
jgi:hypothetical protein